MTLVSSGQISIGGTTSGQSIEVELSQSGSVTASLNDTVFRTLAGKSSGQISLSDFYGKANSNIISENTFNKVNPPNVIYDISKNKNYSSTTSNFLSLYFCVYSVFWSTSTNQAALTLTGGTANDKVTIFLSGGKILGKGGNGGGNGGPATSGGPALSIKTPAHVCISASCYGTSFIGGGGGGGAAGLNKKGWGGGGGGAGGGAGGGTPGGTPFGYCNGAICGGGGKGATFFFLSGKYNFVGATSGLTWRTGNGWGGGGGGGGMFPSPAFPFSGNGGSFSGGAGGGICGGGGGGVAGSINGWGSGANTRNNSTTGGGGGGGYWGDPGGSACATPGGKGGPAILTNGYTVSFKTLYCQTVLRGSII